MPQALQVDWNLIRELYNKGLTLKTIAQQTGVQVGTISARASRAGWKATATKATAIAQNASLTVQLDSPSPESNALAKASSLMRDKLGKELLLAVDTLTATPQSKRIGTQRERAVVLQTLAGASKPVFGWSEGQSSPSVRINVMANAVSITEGEQSKVIECESVPVPTPPTEPV